MYFYLLLVSPPYLCTCHVTHCVCLLSLVPPSQPTNVISNPVEFNQTQLYISWQAPLYLGVPPVSTYIATATSSLDPTNRIITVNTTSVLFDGLLAGLSYDITVVAVSTSGGVSTPGPSSDTVTFSTVPTGKGLRLCSCYVTEMIVPFCQFQLLNAIV